MTRLSVPAIDNAPEAAAELFGKIRKGMGKVPNAYVAIGALSPASLALMLSGDTALAAGSLSRSEIEAVRLAVSAQNGCDYCVAAHSLVGKMAGLAPAELQALRAGKPTGDAKCDALVAFALHVAGSRGTVAADQVQAVFDAGYTSTQVVETLMAIALITFTNLVNRVNDTVVDFPTPA